MRNTGLYLWAILPCFFAFSQNKLTHDVYFETDKYRINETENNRLSLFISKLSDIEIDSISIYGFCDDRGSTDYNLKLSKQRAESIKNTFSNNEINESLISNIDGKGEILLKHIKTENLSKIRGLNRKVEIIVHPKTKVSPIVENERDKLKSIPETIADKNLKIGDKLIFKNILFKTGYSEIIPESQKDLNAIANALAERSDVYFTIQGHVCCTKYSRDAIDRATGKQNLSLARAYFIYNYFVEKGIDKKRMKYVGLRRNFPLGGDSKYDRRVEIVITNIKS